MLILIIFIAAIQEVWAQKSYEMSGMLEEVASDHITLSSDRGHFELKLTPSRIDLLKKFRPGDEVTVWYTLNVIEVIAKGKRSKSKEKELPGRIEPKDHIILDDRAFYDAKETSQKAYPRSS